MKIYKTIFLFLFVQSFGLAHLPSCSSCLPNLGSLQTGVFDIFEYVFFTTQNDIILGIDTELGLDSMDVGQYRICGFSFPKVENDNLSGGGAAYSLSMSSNWVRNYCSDFSNNCVLVNITPKVTDVVVDSSICEGDCISWNALLCCSAGTYFVEDSLNECYYSKILNLTVDSMILINLLVQDTILEDAEPLVLDTMQGGIQGEWSGVGVVDNVFYPEGKNGQIMLLFTPKLGFCAIATQTSSTVETIVQSSNSKEYLRDIFTYLNKNNNLILFSDILMSEEFHFSMLDMNGKVVPVKNKIVFPGTHSVGMAHLQQGIYWLIFASAKGILTKKILKN